MSGDGGGGELKPNKATSKKAWASSKKSAIVKPKKYLIVHMVVHFNVPKNGIFVLYTEIGDNSAYSTRIFRSTILFIGFRR